MPGAKNDTEKESRAMKPEQVKKQFNEEAGKQLAHICSWSQTTPAAVQALLDAGADPDWRPHQWTTTPLMEVVRCQRDPDLVRTLVNGGANVMLGEDGYIALGKTSNPDMVRALLEKDAQKQLTSYQPLASTHLSHAVVHLNADCVIAMLEAGANPAGCANKDFPPLQWAIERGDEIKIDALLMYHPETQINYADKWDQLNPAMKIFNTHWGLSAEMKVRYCTKLMHMGTDLLHRDKHGYDLLHYIHKERDEVKKKLLQEYELAKFNQTIERAIGNVAVKPYKTVMKKKGPQP